MSVPPLNSLKTFMLVAQSLSFKDAADKLFLSPSAVSRQIQGLERSMGVALFTRGNRSISLTAEGETLLGGVKQAFAVLDATLLKVQSAGDQQVLRVGAQQYFSNNWLFPRLSEFIQQHPEIEIQFASSQVYQPFDETALDICIRFSPEQKEGLCCEPFFPQQAILVAAPSLVEKYNLLDQFSNVLGCDWLTVRSQSSLLQQWFLSEDLLPGVSRQVIDQHSHIVFDDAQAALTAAKEGLGVVLAARPLINDLLESKQLIQLGADNPLFTSDYYLVYPQGLAEHEPLRLFRDWLIDQASACLTE
ncbi:hypothetical protein A9Q99_23950 [Gammaproteobacteria bacterium 45_16_T64]|nr:hypothetical protein A9Q99_23950 [Gammaproteobacteria bacterium 45_16_T64]